MKSLTPQDVDAYSEKYDHILLVSPDNTTCRIYGIWYDGKSFSFQKSFFNDPVKVDTTHPDTRVFLEDNTIHIHTQNNDVWIIKELDFDYFVNNEFQVEEMMEEYQVRLCKKRAKELAIYLNRCLDLYDDFGLLVFVSLRADVEYCCDTPNYFSTIVTHNFEIFVTDIDSNIYAGGFLLCLDSTNDAALEVLTRELIRQLLPIQERFKDNF